MGFSALKSAWIAKYGDPMTIIRSSGNISTHARFVKGRQLLAPFDINYVRFMVFPSEAGIQVGDLVKNETLGYQLFVLALEERTLLGETAGVYTELYTVNYPSVTVERLQPGTVDEYGNSSASTWSTVATVPMNVEHVNGNTPYKDGLLLQSTVFRLTMQKSVSIVLEDRVTIDGKPYKVTNINVTDANAMQIVQVEVDMR